jgi:hypothetical protein
VQVKFLQSEDTNPGKFHNFSLLKYDIAAYFTLMIGLIFFLAIIAAVIWYYAAQKKKIRGYKLPGGTPQLLNDSVAFYRDLKEADKRVFEKRIKDFLANTSIRGVGTDIDDLDRLLVASGAIIPIFAFPDWRYNNISEVLIYPAAFTRDYRTTGNGRDVAGMVGDDAMHRQMILSQQSLRQSFSNELDGRNTVIHEFVHLIDKADGAIDGIPEYLLAHPSIIPWVSMIKETIWEMKSKGRGDIDFYGATNEAEFLAVISEYFFERPAKLKANDPELFALLQKMFLPAKSKPATTAKQ